MSKGRALCFSLGTLAEVTQENEIEKSQKMLKEKAYHTLESRAPLLVKIFYFEGKPLGRSPKILENPFV